MRLSERQHNQNKKRGTFIFNCEVMTVISLLLGVYFAVRLLNDEFPSAFVPIQILALGLTSPLTCIFEFGVAPFLPSGSQAVFPTMPVSTLLSMATGQPLSQFSQYQGRVEWLPLMSVFFWQAFLLLTYYCLWYLREGVSLAEVREAVVEYQSANPEKSSRKTPVSVQETQPETQLETRIQSSPETEANIKGRLNDSRNLSQKAPRIQKYNSQDWERYKQQEGQLVAKDMIRQLRQENHNLQAQKNDLQSTFSQYFSPEVLKYLEHNKHAFEGIQNQHYTMSVLFCDLRGFSSYSQAVSSDEVVAYLSEYFEIASYCVLHRYNGVISKLMGDGFMAYWGFPVADKDHAYVATLAAQSILREVQLRNKLKPSQKPIQVGIGVATGDVVVGNIGSMDFKDFTLIGVPVNLAARLQETSKTVGGNLLISQNTYEGLKGRLHCQNWGATQIRGWQNLETVYTPLAQD